MKRLLQINFRPWCSVNLFKIEKEIQRNLLPYLVTGLMFSLSCVSEEQIYTIHFVQRSVNIFYPEFHIVNAAVH